MPCRCYVRSVLYDHMYTSALIMIFFPRPQLNQAHCDYTGLVCLLLCGYGWGLLVRTVWKTLSVIIFECELGRVVQGLNMRLVLAT
jgi:hypothetical protein